MGNTAEQAMQTLTAQWYNAVTTGLHLDPSTFQLIQGNQPLPTTSQQLWAYLDGIPPLSLSNLFNPSEANLFSQSYGAVVMNLKPQNAATWLQAMGDYYGPWAAYLQTEPVMPTGGLQQLFYDWVDLHIPNIAQATTVKTLFLQVQNGVVPTAVRMYLNASTAGKGFAYSNTYENLSQVILPTAPPGSVEMDSSTTSSNVANTWANGSVGGALNLFDGSASVSYNHLTQKFASATVEVSASFTHVAQFAAGPLNQPSSDPILSQYQPWYYSPALVMAYQTSDNTVWNNTPPTWNGTFGPDGNLQRLCSALIVVEGIQTTITSAAQFSSSEQQQFQAAASGGVWPFFAVSGSSGWNSSVKFFDNGTVTVSSSLPAGNPQILGCIVTPISAVLANHQAAVQFSRLQAAAVLAG